ncbi:hypothetical protein QJS66_17610 [Kocuria rhizophila]|nr:hypothetical protein QJS66_17610 [Kocuria rhizophila]
MSCCRCWRAAAWPGAWPSSRGRPRRGCRVAVVGRRPSSRRRAAVGGTGRRGGAARWVARSRRANPTVGLVAIGGLLVLGLVGAVLGELWGIYYHRKVDT